MSVLIIGAGPAGLATAAELSRRGIENRLVERGAMVGHSWHNVYDSLALHTGKHMSGLPGRGFPRSASLFPTRAEMLAYLQDYKRAFGIDVETGMDIKEIRREKSRWIATSPASSLDAETLVITTGIMANPRVPRIPGRSDFGGHVIHSVTYRRPEPYVGKRILVVGAGNSGAEIAAELGTSGARVTILVRTWANVVPRQIAGIPVQYLAYALRKLPAGVRRRVARGILALNERRRGPALLPRPPWGPLDAIPLIGFNLVDAIRQGLVEVKTGTVGAFIAGGVRFSDGTEAQFDHVILATGFAPALDALGTLIRRDKHGFALRSDRVTSADQPELFYVGHNYDSTGGLTNIRRDARQAAARIARGRTGRRSES
jgi:cation diffusion facilitator CzcD-associated flavoprotein CzcO